MTPVTSASRHFKEPSRTEALIVSRKLTARLVHSDTMTRRQADCRRTGGVRDRFGRGLALVGQDYLRRIVLRERDLPSAASIGLIDAGYHVVRDGILYTDHCADMLTQLRAEHRGPTRAYYLHVSFTETLARHARRPTPWPRNQSSQA